MRHTLVYFRALLSIVAILVAFGASALAQDLQGSISGKVSDPQEAVIPAASVVVTNAETGAVRRTQTNAVGYFEVSLLNPGTYSITVEAAGFKKLTRSGLELQVSGHLEVPLALAVGQVTEAVVVTAGAPLLDTTSADNGRTIDRRQIMELPFADANPFLMASLAAGMSYTGNPKDNGKGVLASLHGPVAAPYHPSLAGPIGGIAHAGIRGISKVELRVDSGEWMPAELACAVEPLPGGGANSWRVCSRTEANLMPQNAKGHSSKLPKEGNVTEEGRL